MYRGSYELAGARDRKEVQAIDKRLTGKRKPFAGKGVISAVQDVADHFLVSHLGVEWGEPLTRARLRRIIPWLPRNSLVVIYSRCPLWAQRHS
jgi:hypothetical protein